MTIDFAFTVLGFICAVFFIALITLWPINDNPVSYSQKFIFVLCVCATAYFTFW